MYSVSLSSLPSYHIFHRIDHQEQTWAHIIMIIITRRKRNIMKSQVNIYIVLTTKPIIKNGKRMLQRAVNRIHNQTRPRQNHDLPKHICSQRMLLNRKIQFYKEYFASNGNSHEMFTQHIVVLNLISPSYFGCIILTSFLNLSMLEAKIGLNHLFAQYFLSQGDKCVVPCFKTFEFIMSVLKSIN